MVCEICRFQSQPKSKSGFSKHIKKYHNMSPEEYTLKYLCAGIVFCKCGCGQKPNYAKKEFRFYDLIHNHHKPTLGTTRSAETKKKISEKITLFYDNLSSEERKERAVPLRDGLQRLLKDNGVSSTIELPGIRNKIKKTNIQRYGSEYPTQNKFIQEKIKQTNLMRYGVECPAQCEQFKLKTEKTNIDKYGVKSYSQTEEARVLFSKTAKLSWNEILQHCEKKQYIPLFSESFYNENYKGNRQILSFKCLKHGKDFDATLVNIQRDKEQCPECKSFFNKKAQKKLPLQ